ncbi:MAG: class I SAM-dependent methyltransferase [Halobacteriovoraceae bacterium]|nr:class I SAM-dependent methyltransferase [Halobacteriovoraceae bacterium]
MTSKAKDISFSEKILFKILKNLKRGSISLETPDGKTLQFRGSDSGVEAQLKVHDWSLVEALLTRGDIGFGEAYRDGLWESQDISKVILLAVQNESVLKKVIVGNAFKIVPYIIKHKMNRNTEKGSRKNIEAHYDLGNEFYELWLDESMTYSSAFFDGNESLKEAQKNKYQKILKKLGDLPEDSKVLEVGCGWGGFIKEAKPKNWEIRGITLSKEQKAFVDRHHGKGAYLQDYRKEKRNL